MPDFKAPNGLAITGTLETLSGNANIVGISLKGEPEYSGDTEVWWDEQKTVEREGKTIFLDEEGGEWTFDQLVLDEGDDEDEEAEGHADGEAAAREASS